MRFLFLEPFFGGSHRSFAEGLSRWSRHEIDLLTLPARFWKWRMRGAALHFLRKISSSLGPPLDAYDGLITTDLMSLSDFKAITGPACPPALAYFHESQITYPLAPGERMDFQFGFTDMTTALAADRVLFNSQTHWDAFFSALPDFLNIMPEYRPKWVIDAIRAKSDVLHPGCQFPAERGPLAPFPMDPPLIIWNHRWEFDKDPDSFFDALECLVEQGLSFRVALIGENFQVVPKAFVRGKKRLQERIIQYGYLESREDYLDMLRQGAMVISTAQQENFGISVVEAIRQGCIPLLPNRLAYPEIIPPAFHSDVLYADQADLVQKLASLVRAYPQITETRERLSESMGRFAWKNLIQRYDDELERLQKISL